MSKLAVTGHNPRTLIDCSDAVPVPKPPVAKPATFPAGTNRGMVQQACPKPFPVLKTDGKPLQLIPYAVLMMLPFVNISWRADDNPRVP